MTRHATAAEQQATARQTHQEWRDQAACRGLARLMDPPWTVVGTEAATVQTAKLLCRGCPVSLLCRAWVLDLPERCDPGGVCGGMSQPERKTYRARTAAARSPRTRKKAS